ncbi:MAG TPA: 3-methyl-2-oxobutanoate hydroxymethyltransferase [Bacillota bacterium]|nr:3-methyl-2-oxobutanoate hydroxymethyltransferase [Bacillota bacterium]HPL53039.1 3-methyl-2-oxobutanoate hydroxymethyltransferase [Bacillota bacterium]
MAKKKLSVQDIIETKKNSKKFSMITVYDYQMASIVDQSDIEMILVGDSLGMVILGLEGTTPVNIEEMEYHLKAVRRGAPNTFIVGDMSFMSYQVCKEDAIRNAGKLMKLGADCVKMEGGFGIMDKIKAVTEIGIPVMAHIGVTPQTAAAFGGFKVQGKSTAAAERLIKEAIAAEEAGAFSIVIECLPAQLNALINKTISIPIISTGSGASANGFNLNAYDMLGIFDSFKPKFVKQYAQMRKEIVDAFNAWNKDVTDGVYPSYDEEFHMKEEDLPKINK